jgi:acyl-coenzyme A synthetase/AMP-(fatty) acid ligase
VTTTAFSAGTLWEAFDSSARAHANRCAVALDADIWTYSRLRDEADAVRKWIGAEVPRGPLLLQPRNTPASVAVLLGCLASKRIPLLADPAWSGAELRGVIDRCGVRAAMWEGRPPAGLDGLGLTGQRAGVGLWQVTPPPAHADAMPVLDDTAFGRFTSGTTGAPRCLQFRDRAALSATRGWSEASGLTKADVVLCLATLNNGLAYNTSLFTVLLSGGTLAFHPGMLVRGAIARTLARVQPTVVVAFPFVYELLVSGPRAPFDDRLRLAVSSAAPLTAAVRQAFADRYGLPICDYYGIAEVGPCTFNDGSHVDSKGVPLSSVTFAVTDEAGRQVAAGETGRIRVLTASMASAYLDLLEPPFSSHVDERGFYVTNDRGTLTSGGALQLGGRLDRVVNVAGRKIAPGEVEAVLRRIPGVSDAVVRGEEELGRTFLAAYIESTTLARDQIVSFCATNMAQYKVPQRIVIVPKLPRSSAGKISLSGLAAHSERHQ